MTVLYVTHHLVIQPFYNVFGICNRDHLFNSSEDAVTAAAWHYNVAEALHLGAGGN